MIRTVLAALLLTPPSLAAQAEESQLVTYDLRRVMPRWDEGNSWQQTLLVPPVLNPRDEIHWIPAERYGGWLSFELLDLLNQILGDELRREGREMLVEGDALTVLAPAALQQQVRVILEGLEQALAGTLTLSVDVFQLAEGAPEPASVLLSDEEGQKLVAALAASGSAQRTTTVQLSAGRTTVVDSILAVPFLWDHDVEIAQEITAFDPLMSETRSGTRLVLRAAAQPGGALLSVLQLGSELRGMRDIELSLEGTLTRSDKPPFRLPGPARVQSPDLDLVSFAFDTFLPDGKALALGFESNLAGKKARQVVVLRRLASTLGSYVVRQIPGTNRSLIALDAELFRPARLETDVAVSKEPTQGLSPLATASLSFETSGFLIEWIKARFSIWRPFGPWILIVTDPAWDRDANAQLERLVKGLKPRTSLSEATFELRAGSARTVRARLPLLEGTRAGLAVAHGRTALLDYDVEVAQGASVHDPLVSSLFEGLVLSCLAQGDLAEVRGLAQLVTAAAPIEAGGVGFGKFECFETQTLRFDERVRVAPGRPLRLGPVAEKGVAGLVLELTLAPLGR
jgi:hypothetical protein